MAKFNLQRFNDMFEGIDEDILQELAPQEEEVKEEPQAEESEETHAEADSDTKQVEQTEDNEEEYQAVGNVPYARFNDVNTKRKAAEARIKELEEQLAKQAANPAPQPKQEETVPSDFNAEQIQKITKLAMQRAAQKLNLTQDDAENIEYSDDPTQKMVYQNLVASETKAVMDEVRAYNAKMAEFQKQTAEVTQEFNSYQTKINSYPDVQERWNYISVERFNQLPPRKQQIINEAFMRIQSGKGTYHDMDTVSDYFESANKEWEQRLIPKNNNAKKIEQAQTLPKAPNVAGGSSADKVYTPESIAAILNTPGGFETLPQEIIQQVLKGRLR